MRKYMVLLLLLALPVIASGQVSEVGKPVKVITDADIVGNMTFYSDTVYNLQGFVFVESGETLTIEPGTIIKSNTGQGLDASALIVAKGGQVFADGSASSPIIFTTIMDDVDDPNDIPTGDAGRALWGGIILLGEAVINTSTGVGNIEGLPGETRTEYGGNNDDDNSGILRYVSIRHGGSVFGTANEINGLTMGAVGRGTTIDYVEVFQNVDDGFEWFGGTVNCKHLVAAYCGDDAFDIDEGFSGAGQFWFTIQDGIDGDKGGEHDGGTDPENGTPFATPLISNVTYLGAGLTPTVAGKNSGCFNIRDNCSPAYYNSIFSDHAGYGVKVEQRDVVDEPTDSEDRLLAGDMVFQNNVWGNFAAGNTAADLVDGQTWTETIFTNASFNNVITDPGICLTRTATGDNDLRPGMTDNFPAWTTPTVHNPPSKPNHGAQFVAFFDEVDYLGAFDPAASATGLWIADWTAFATYGYPGENDDCLVVGCCGIYTDPAGYTGNTNCSTDGKLTLSDITALIDHVYISKSPLCCQASGNTNGSVDGKVTLSDITRLIDRVYISKGLTEPCM